jgi:hypothetical protein
MLESWINSLLAAFSLPSLGLPAVFVISLVSATLLPLGSEPAVFGLVKLDPSMFWPAIGGGHRRQHAGRRHQLVDGLRRRGAVRTCKHKRFEARALQWLERFGPKACLLSWLPGVGDPLCARGRLPQAAVLALRAVHGDRQVPALRDHDRGAAVGVPGPVHTVARMRHLPRPAGAGHRGPP